MTTALQKAAQAMIDRWESLQYASTLTPQVFEPKILKLRKALDAELVQSVEPYAVFQGLVDSGEHGAFNLDLLKMIPRGAYLYLHPPQPQATTPAVPDGYVLVPIEPTDEELAKGGVRAMRMFVTKNSLIDFSLGYKAMLTAAQGEVK